jgi:hypothetical protein
MILVPAKKVPSNPKQLPDGPLEPSLYLHKNALVLREPIRQL